MEKLRIEQHSWKGVTGILLWPVYLGLALSPLLDAIAKRGSP